MMATANVGLNLLLQLTTLLLLAGVATALLGQPRHRFSIWLGVLLISGASWLRFLWQIAVPSRSGAAVPQRLSAALPHFQATVALPATPLPWRALVMPLVDMLPRLYLAGLACFLAGALLRHWQLRRMVRSGQPPASGLQRRFEELCRSLHLRRCRLVLLPAVTSPTTTGCWRPLVLLPDALATDLAEPSLAWILRHELIHVRRWDYVWNRLAAAVCAVLFFHPLVWLAWKRMQQERELACDEAVVRMDGDGRPDYADCLMQMAKWRMLAAPGWREVGFSRSGSVLALRIQTLLRRRAPHVSRARSLAAALGLVSLLLVPIFLPALEFQFTVPAATRGLVSTLMTRVRPPSRAFGSRRVLQRSRSRSADASRATSLALVRTGTVVPNLPAYDLRGTPPSVESDAATNARPAAPEPTVRQPVPIAPAPQGPEEIASVRPPAGRTWPRSRTAPSITRSSVVLGVVAGIARAVSSGGGGGSQVDGDNFRPR